MKLPGQTSLIVPKAKLMDYLLSLTHNSGRSKAQFFLSVGFSVETWTDLADTLRWHAQTYEVTKIEESPFGLRYVIEGWIQTPVDRRVYIRSVWFDDQDGSPIRFVTAYPIKE